MNSKKLNYILVIFWLIIVIFTMFHHEIWRDEARVWWFVKEYDYSKLFNVIINDGHPFLWYAILMPFAKNGFPLITMQISSVLAVFFSVCIFCFKSKFNFFIKLLFVFSSGMLYFMPVIARNYAVIPIILFVIAVLYPKRNESRFLYTLCIILLSQTHVLMWGTSFILWILFAYEQIKEFQHSSLKQKLLISLNLLFFVVYSGFMVHLYVPVMLTSNYKLIKKFFEPVTFSFFSEFKFLFMHKVLQCSEIWKYIYIASMMLLSGVILKVNYKSFLILFCSVLFMIYIFVHIWFGGIPYQKYFLITVIFVFCCMILDVKSKYDNIILQVSLLLFLSVSSYVFNPIKFIQEYIKYNFTNTKEVSDFLHKRNIRAGEKFLLIDYKYTLDDTWKVYFDGYIYKSRIFIELDDDYISKIREEIEKRPKLEYIAVNDKYRKYIQNTNLVPIIQSSQREKVRIYGFNSNEYYNLYKSGKKL